MIRQPPEYLSWIARPEWLVDPYPTFKLFKQRWPIARVDWPQQGAGEWLATRYADVRRALNSAEFSIDRSAADLGDTNSAVCPLDGRRSEPLFGTVLMLDAQDHIRLRKPLSAQLIQQLGHLRPRLEAVTELLLAEHRDRQCFDLMEDFAAPLTAVMVGDLLGLSSDTFKKLQQWSSAYVSRGFTFGPGFVSREVQCAVAQLKGHLRGVVWHRRRAPGDDLISAMLQSSVSDAPLVDERIVNSSLLLLTAGMQTTKHAIVNGVAALIESPHAWPELLADVSLVPSAVEECLRYDGPSQAVGRVAKVDVELGDVRIPKGAFVRLALASANRDENQFTCPDEFDVRRKPNRHFGFGGGSHHCAGAQLTRLAMQIAIWGLLRHFRSLAVVPQGAKRELHSSLRGFTCFEVAGCRHRH